MKSILDSFSRNSPLLMRYYLAVRGQKYCSRPSNHRGISFFPGQMVINIAIEGKNMMQWKKQIEELSLKHNQPLQLYLMNFVGENTDLASLSKGELESLKDSSIEMNLDETASTSALSPSTSFLGDTSDTNSVQRSAIVPN